VYIEAGDLKTCDKIFDESVKIGLISYLDDRCKLVITGSHVLPLHILKLRYLTSQGQRAP
jgi:hypothetical protein